MIHIIILCVYISQLKQHNMYIQSMRYHILQSIDLSFITLNSDVIVHLLVIPTLYASNFGSIHYVIVASLFVVYVR